MYTKAERMQQDIDRIARCTSTSESGTTRFSYTKEHKLARDYIITRMQEAGLAVREDAVGNLIGRREGTEPALAAVMTGSHFDTVYCGGNYDGAAGVAAGLEAARVMQEQGLITKRPLEFIAMVGEEGGRFGAAFLGSRAIAGLLTQEELHSLWDTEGVSIGEAMKDFGLDPDQIQSAVRTPKQLYAFLEMHIEQGPVLEQTGTELGIVDCIVANRTLEFTLTGRADHAGTTPMHMRADAFLASAKLSQMAMEQAIALGEGTVATMGQISVYPGSTNIIPGKVVFTLDIRSKEEKFLEQMQNTLLAAMHKMIAQGQIADGRLQALPGAGTVEMDSHIMHVLEACAIQQGFSCRKMTSGAGHDAMVLAQLAPVGMLFVPSKAGRSHCPEEWTDYEQMQKGCETLLKTLLILGNETGIKQVI